jgi:hypothetical protein
MLLSMEECTSRLSLVNSKEVRRVRGARAEARSLWLKIGAVRAE